MFLSIYELYQTLKKMARVSSLHGNVWQQSVKWRVRVCEQMLESKEAIKHHRQKYMFYDGMERGEIENGKREYMPWVSKIV